VVSKSRKGNKFNYAKKRDLIESGWQSWGGDNKLAQNADNLFLKMLERYGL
jgi:hypothetical protein